MLRISTLALLLSFVAGCGSSDDSGPKSSSTGGTGGAAGSTSTGGTSTGGTSSGGTSAGGQSAGGGSAGATGIEYPVPDWKSGTPEDHGLDSAALDDAIAVAADLESYCLLVIRHGVLVSETYFGTNQPADTHPSWSIAKSYSSALVGIAIDRGEIQSLDQSVSDFIPEWKADERKNITVKHLVSMTSGLKWSVFQDYVSMAVFSPDNSQFATELPSQEPPESSWIYHNGGVQMLEPLFRAATGKTLEEYAELYLWSKLGMTATWSKDDAGHPTAYANVLATCRDHARLGYLYLHGGSWANDEQVVPAAWVSATTTPSQPYNRAYGYLWWLNGETPAMDAMMAPWPARMSPVAPPDMFAARGFGNQFIDVIPSLDMVVVRFGPDPAGQFDLAALTADQHFAKHDQILGALLAAVQD